MWEKSQRDQDITEDSINNKIIHAHPGPPRILFESASQFCIINILFL